MNKKLSAVFLALTLLIFSLSLGKCLSFYKFNSNSVKENITYLSSDTFKGRLPGTFGNVKASAYIKSQLKKYNIKPLGKDYYENFNIVYPEKIVGVPVLKVLDAKGEAIKIFNYGSDFKEDTLCFKQNHVTFNKNSSINITKNYIKITSGKNICVFFTPEDNNISFRSSFDADSPISMVIMVKTKTLETLKQYIQKNNTIDCYIPYKQSNTKVQNVVGCIKGKNKNLSPIVLSAHFDHLGEDLSGNIYHGALDNASGTCFILEMAHYLESLGKPDRDIIIAAFNGEEFGFKGSSAFLKEYGYNLKNAEVFNFDMIGAKSSIPLSIMGSKSDTSNTPLIKSLSNLCKDTHVKYNLMFENSSDHTSFRQNNIDAVSFCNDDISRIHTPKDTGNFIDEKSIQTCFYVVSKEILPIAFKSSPFVIYNKLILVFSGACLIICITYILFSFKKKKHSNRKNQ